MIGMSNQPSPPSETEIAAHLDSLAGDYKHNPIQHVILNPFKNAILTFRAKYATYENITSTLTNNGVKVSEATVRKFCRTHLQEVKRLRTEIDRKRRETEGTTGPKTTSLELSESTGTTDDRRSSLTSDVGKPGPKIARERL
jgi:hypothetical protein